MGKEEAALLLGRAEDCLREAQALFDIELFPGSVNRAYYAVFNSVQCVLQLKDIMVKTHQGAHVKFAENYIKPGIFSKETGQIPQQVEEIRLRGDYESGQIITKEEALKAIDLARSFYTSVKNFLGNQR